MTKIPIFKSKFKRPFFQILPYIQRAAILVPQVLTSYIV